MTPPCVDCRNFGVVNGRPHCAKGETSDMHADFSCFRPSAPSGKMTLQFTTHDGKVSYAVDWQMSGKEMAEPLDAQMERFIRPALFQIRLATLPKGDKAA